MHPSEAALEGGSGAAREVPIGALRVYPYWLGQYAAEGRVSARAVLLWAEIASMIKHGRRSRCDASLRFLASRLPPGRSSAGESKPVSERTVERLIEQLVAARALTVYRQLGKPNTYLAHLEPLPEQEGLPLFGDGAAGGPGSRGPAAGEGRPPAKDSAAAPSPGGSTTARDPNGIGTGEGPNPSGSDSGPPECPPEETPTTTTSDTSVGGPPTIASDTGVGQNRGKQSAETQGQATPDVEDVRDKALREMHNAAAAGDNDASVDAYEKLLDELGRAAQPAGAAEHGRTYGTGDSGTGGNRNRGGERALPAWAPVLDGVFEQAPAGLRPENVAEFVVGKLDERAPTREEVRDTIRDVLALAPRDCRLEELTAAASCSVYGRLAVSEIARRVIRERLVLADREPYFRAMLNGIASDVQGEIRRRVDTLLDRKQRGRAA